MPHIHISLKLNIDTYANDEGCDRQRENGAWEDTLPAIAGDGTLFERAPREEHTGRCPIYQDSWSTYWS